MVLVPNPHEKRGVAVFIWCVGMESTMLILFILRELYCLSLAVLFCWVLPAICFLSFFPPLFISSFIGCVFIWLTVIRLVLFSL